MAKRAFNLPNLLTYARIVAVPLVVVCFFLEGHLKSSDFARWSALAIFLLASITDYFDGYLARAQKTVSRLGVFLDPIADKIMVVAVIVMLISSRQASGEPVIHDFHIVPALVILLREITVSGLREFLAGLQVSVPVSQLAKWKTTFQMVALGALILGGAIPRWEWVHDIGLASLWAAAILTIVTGWDYLRVGLKHMD